MGIVLLNGCVSDRTSLAEPSVPSSVSGQQFVERVSEEDVVLDVRTPSEFAAGHLVGALNVDFRAAGFREQIGELDRDKTYYVYCRTGNRSGQTQRLMREMGFTSVINAGGFAGLARAGAPTAK